MIYINDPSVPAASSVERASKRKRVSFLPASPTLASATQRRATTVEPRVSSPLSILRVTNPDVDHSAESLPAELSIELTANGVGQLPSNSACELANSSSNGVSAPLSDLQKAGTALRGPGERAIEPDEKSVDPAKRVSSISALEISTGRGRIIPAPNNLEQASVELEAVAVEAPRSLSLSALGDVTNRITPVPATEGPRLHATLSAPIDSSVHMRNARHR